jgi:hypothetical protein
MEGWGGGGDAREDMAGWSVMQVGYAMVDRFYAETIFAELISVVSERNSNDLFIVAVSSSRQNQPGACEPSICVCAFSKASPRP